MGRFFLCWLTDVVVFRTGTWCVCVFVCVLLRVDGLYSTGLNCFGGCFGLFLSFKRAFLLVREGESACTTVFEMRIEQKQYS